MIGQGPVNLIYGIGIFRYVNQKIAVGEWTGQPVLHLISRSLILFINHHLNLTEVGPPPCVIIDILDHGENLLGRCRNVGNLLERFQRLPGLLERIYFDSVLVPDQNPRFSVQVTDRNLDDKKQAGKENPVKIGQF